MAVLSASTSPMKANLHSPHAANMMSPHHHGSPKHFENRPRSASHTSDSGFALSTSPTRTSSALSPSKLDIPKARKAWDRSARPSADPNSKVRVVWEKFDLRRAKAGIGLQSGQQGDAAGEYRRSPSKIVKKAKIAASEDVDVDDMTKRRNIGRRTKDFVATDRERRTSRSSSLRKLPHQSEELIQQGDVAQTLERDSTEATEGHEAAEAEEETDHDDSMNSQVGDVEAPSSLPNLEGTMPAASPVPAVTVHVTQHLSHDSNNQDVTCEAPASLTDTSTQESTLTATESSTIASVAARRHSSSAEHLTEMPEPAPSPEHIEMDAFEQDSLETEDSVVQDSSNTAPDTVVMLESSVLASDVEVSISYLDKNGHSLASSVQTVAELPTVEVTIPIPPPLSPKDEQSNYAVGQEVYRNLRSAINTNDKIEDVSLSARTEAMQAGNQRHALLILPSVDDLFSASSTDRHSPKRETPTSTVGDGASVQIETLELLPAPEVAKLSGNSLISDNDSAESLETQSGQVRVEDQIGMTDADMLESDDDEDLSEEGGLADYNDTIKLSIVHRQPINCQDEDAQPAEKDDEEPVAMENEIAANTQAEHDTSLDITMDANTRNSSQPSSTWGDATNVSNAPDEKSILASFVARAAASRAARSTIITRRVSLQNKQDSDAVRQALASPSRQVLEEKDVNITPRRSNLSFGSPSTTMLGGLGVAPSPSKSSASPSVGVLKLTSPVALLPVVAAAKKADAVVESPVRRSSRNVLAKMQAANEAAAAAQTTKKISVRRTEWEGAAIMAEKAAERDLAALLRTNTRKNKEDAVNVPTRIILLKHQKDVEAPEASAVTAQLSQVSKIEIVVKAGKAVQWAETIADYREIPARSPDPDAPVRPTGLRKPPASRIRISNSMIAGGAKSTDQQTEKKAEESSEGQEKADDEAVASMVAAPKSSTQRALKGLRKMKANQAKKLAKAVEPSDDTKEPADAAIPVDNKRKKEAQNRVTAPSLLPMPWSADAGGPASVSQSDIPQPRTRLPAPQASKLPALAFAPSTRSITKPNATSDAVNPTTVTSKLKSPKKVSLLPMPTPVLGATTAVSAPSALGTPARKKAGIRRKKIA